MGEIRDQSRKKKYLLKPEHSLVKNYGQTKRYIHLSSIYVAYTSLKSFKNTWVFPRKIFIIIIESFLKRSDFFILLSPKLYRDEWNLEMCIFIAFSSSRGRLEHSDWTALLSINDKLRGFIICLLKSKRAQRTVTATVEIVNISF